MNQVQIMQSVVEMLPDLIRSVMEESDDLPEEDDQDRVPITYGEFVQYADDPDGVFVSHPLGQIVRDGFDILQRPSESSNHGKGVRYEAVTERIRVYGRGVPAYVTIGGCGVRLMAVAPGAEGHR